MAQKPQILQLLETVPPEGLHIRELATLNDLNDGFAAELGIRFVEVKQESITAELHIGHKHLQVSGVVNGGVYSALAETVGSILGVIAARGNLVMGINNNTDFLAPVSAGIISAEASIIRNGRKTQLISVEMFHRDKLVARSTLRTFVSPKPAEENPGRPKDKFAE